MRAVINQLKTDTGDDGVVFSFHGLEYGATTMDAFVNGFEFGRIWERMSHGNDDKFTVMLQTINVEALRRAATADGWNVNAFPIEQPIEFGEWSVATLTKGDARCV